MTSPYDPEAVAKAMAGGVVGTLAALREENARLRQRVEELEPDRNAMEANWGGTRSEMQEWRDTARSEMAGRRAAEVKLERAYDHAEEWVKAANGREMNAIHAEALAEAEVERLRSVPDGLQRPDADLLRSLPGDQVTEDRYWIGWTDALDQVRAALAPCRPRPGGDAMSETPQERPCECGGPQTCSCNPDTCSCARCWGETPQCHNVRGEDGPCDCAGCQDVTALLQRVEELEGVSAGNALMAQRLDSEREGRVAAEAKLAEAQKRIETFEESSAADQRNANRAWAEVERLRAEMSKPGAAWGVAERLGKRAEAAEAEVARLRDVIEAQAQAQEAIGWADAAADLRRALAPEVKP